jgi:hypothetical protein
MAAAETNKSPVHYLERIARSGTRSTVQPPVTGVAVSDAGIHAALVTLGYITA